MSHSSTIKLFDCMGKDFDSEVLQWKETIEKEVMPYLPDSEVRIMSTKQPSVHIQLHCRIQWP